MGTAWYVVGEVVGGGGGWRLGDEDAFGVDADEIDFGRMLFERLELIVGEVGGAEDAEEAEGVEGDLEVVGGGSRGVGVEEAVEDAEGEEGHEEKVKEELWEGDKRLAATESGSCDGGGEPDFVGLVADLARGGGVRVRARLNPGLQAGGVNDRGAGAGLDQLVTFR